MKVKAVELLGHHIDGRLVTDTFIHSNGAVYYGYAQKINKAESIDTLVEVDDKPT